MDSQRSIHEMLKEVPPMNETTSVILQDARISRPTNLQVSQSSSSSLPQSTITSPTFNSPLSPTQNGDSFIKNGASKIDSLKNWSISTYKCTRQIM